MSDHDYIDPAYLLSLKAWRLFFQVLWNDPMENKRWAILFVLDNPRLFLGMSRAAQ